MIAMDSQTGKEVANLLTVEAWTESIRSAAQANLYSGGRDYDVGYVFVYQQKDADHYEAIGK